MPPMKSFSAPLLDCSTCCRPFTGEAPGLWHVVCPHCGAYYMPSWPTTPHDE